MVKDHGHPAPTRFGAEDGLPERPGERAERGAEAPVRFSSRRILCLVPAVLLVTASAMATSFMEGSNAQASLAPGQPPGVQGKEVAKGKVATAPGPSSGGADAGPCLLPPPCLAVSSPQRCLGAPIRKRPECGEFKEFCDKHVYRTASGVLVTLPLMTGPELMRLYASNRSQMVIASPNHWRPKQQAETIVKSGLLARRTGLTILEMGCAAGFVLYNLRAHAANGGNLVCFEGDPTYSDLARETLQRAKNSTSGLNYRFFPTLFNGSKFKSRSVDIFTSSHVLEHLPEPCQWLDELRRILKPGGLVFTEVPDQIRDPVKGITRGQFHLLYFADREFRHFMESNGFVHVRFRGPKVPAGVVRRLYRKL